MPTLPPLPAVPPALRALLVPLAIAVLALLLLAPVAALPLAARQLLNFLPYVLLLATLLLAQYFNRAREFACGLLLLCAYWVIRARLQTPLDEAVPQALFAWLGIVIPAALTLQFAAGERGLWTWASTRLVLAGPLALLAGLLLLGSGGWPAELLASAFAAKPFAGYVLSLGASALFALALAGMAVLSVTGDSDIEPALPACLVCAFIALAFFHVAHISTLMFSAAALILIAGLLQRSYRMAYRDELTGLRGRRALEERLLTLGPRYGIALLDVDHFKRFNDTHGHKAGDDVLRMVAGRLAAVGGGGTAYRYGGEEFCIVFPRRRAAECVPHLHALREEIEHYPLSLRDAAHRPDTIEDPEPLRGAGETGAAVHVTISIGLAEPTEPDDTPRSVLQEADRALYAAKEAGRNRLGWYPAATGAVDPAD